jgi:hypothetical protein
VATAQQQLGVLLRALGEGEALPPVWHARSSSGQSSTGLLQPQQRMPLPAAAKAGGPGATAVPLPAATAGQAQQQRQQSLPHIKPGRRRTKSTQSQAAAAAATEPAAVESRRPARSGGAQQNSQWQQQQQQTPVVTLQKLLHEARSAAGAAPSATVHHGAVPAAASAATAAAATAAASPLQQQRLQQRPSPLQHLGLSDVKAMLTAVVSPAAGEGVLDVVEAAAAAPSQSLDAARLEQQQQQQAMPQPAPKMSLHELLAAAARPPRGAAAAHMQPPDQQSHPQQQEGQLGKLVNLQALLQKNMGGNDEASPSPTSSDVARLLLHKRVDLEGALAAAAAAQRQALGSQKGTTTTHTAPQAGDEAATPSLLELVCSIVPAEGGAGGHPARLAVLSADTPLLTAARQQQDGQQLLEQPGAAAAAAVSLRTAAAAAEAALPLSNHAAAARIAALEQQQQQAPAPAAGPTAAAGVEAATPPAPPSPSSSSSPTAPLSTPSASASPPPPPPLSAPVAPPLSSSSGASLDELLAQLGAAAPLRPHSSTNSHDAHDEDTTADNLPRQAPTAAAVRSTATAATVKRPPKLTPPVLDLCDRLQQAAQRSVSLPQQQQQQQQQPSLAELLMGAEAVGLRSDAVAAAESSITDVLAGKWTQSRPQQSTSTPMAAQARAPDRYAAPHAEVAAAPAASAAALAAPAASAAAAAAPATPAAKAPQQQRTQVSGAPPSAAALDRATEHRMKQLLASLDSDRDGGLLGAGGTVQHRQRNTEVRVTAHQRHRAPPCTCTCTSTHQ